MFSVKQAPKSEKTDDSLEDIVDSTEYNPEKNSYHPIKHACWKHKERSDIYSVKFLIQGLNLFIFIL